MGILRAEHAGPHSPPHTHISPQRGLKAVLRPPHGHDCALLQSEPMGTPQHHLPMISPGPPASPQPGLAHLWVGVQSLPHHPAAQRLHPAHLSLSSPIQAPLLQSLTGAPQTQDHRESGLGG